MNGEKRAQCCLPGGCLERDDPCLLAKVTLPYRTAGIATISDWSIVNRLVSLNDAFGKIYCLRDRQTPSHISLKEKFIQQINRTWNIADPNAKNAIMNDPNRDKAAKKEDLAFFEDYFGPDATRKSTILGPDTNFVASLLTQEAKENRKKFRDQKEKERREKEEVKRRERLQIATFDDENEGEMMVVEQNNNNEGSIDNIREREGDKSSDEGVWLCVPKKILKDTAAAAIRFGLSVTSHTGMVAAFITAAGGDLDEFSLSPIHPHIDIGMKLWKKSLRKQGITSKKLFRKKIWFCLFILME